MSVGRILLTLLKVFLLLVVIAMIRFQIPELRYDFGTKTPMNVQSVDELSLERFPRSTFAKIRGKANFTNAATFAKHGVRYTYFLLDEYGNKLVVRTPEAVTEDWAGIDFHVGRLRPYHRMPFSRSVRAGFRKLFDVGIPEDAFFLARDDVPRPTGWSVGGMSFACILFCVLTYFFFIHRCVIAARSTKNNKQPSNPET
jgi:hypothetical protein